MFCAQARAIFVCFVGVYTSCAAHPARLSDKGVLEGLSTSVKGAIHSQFNGAILLCDVIPDGRTE